MSTQKKRGFTIVELLVVIAIIGMLMALLVPAVQVAVGRARQANCLNNTKQIGMALYTQATSKGYFPGRLSMMMDSSGADPIVDVNGQEGVTWVMQILPNLEQQVLQDYLRDLGTMYPADTSSMYLPVLICPSDVPSANNVPALSYVVNGGIQDLPVSDPKIRPDIKANGIFHDLRNPLTRSGLQVGLDEIVDGASTTIMASENVDAGYWNSLEELDHAIVWNVERRLRINDLRGTRVPGDYSDYGFARPSSYHSGGANVVFCGNNATFLRDSIDYRVYVQLMTPDGRKSRVNLASGSPEPAPLDFWTPPLAAKDYE
jgi:prepilin-type N-terminal cleavage/methylation domain-containing protein/prepilin-type processing-associated H-X9-DG protein